MTLLFGAALLAGADRPSPQAPAPEKAHPAKYKLSGPFTHANLTIYLIHGALDWMFPVYTARVAQEALRTAGARLVYREIADLSHTYPRDENPRILDWLMTP